MFLLQWDYFYFKRLYFLNFFDFVLFFLNLLFLMININSNKDIETIAINHQDVIIFNVLYVIKDIEYMVSLILVIFCFVSAAVGFFYFKRLYFLNFFDFVLLFLNLLFLMINMNSNKDIEIIAINHQDVIIFNVLCVMKDIMLT